MKDNRIVSFIIILIIYIIAGIIGYITYFYLPFNFYINILISDVITTVVVYIFSLIFKNASIYDPYWSVYPLVLAFVLLLTQELNIVRALISISVIGWGLRLTINWAYTFKNLNSMDWRYTMLKEKTKLFYPIVNLLGIHLMPTLIVYLCILPVLFIYNNEVEFNTFVLIFFALSVFAFLMQALADLEMHKFKKNASSSEFIRVGLWKYSRHPNYLGEILMWWMISLAAIFALKGDIYLIAGASINTMLFLFISIPMAEKRQMGRKPNFIEYKKQTRMLLPIYKKEK